MFFFGDEFFKVGKALFGIAQKLFFFLFGDGVLVLIGSGEEKGNKRESEEGSRKQAYRPSFGVEEHQTGDRKGGKGFVEIEK